MDISGYPISVCLYHYVQMTSTYIFKLFGNLCRGEMCEKHPCHDWPELYPVSSTNQRFRLFACQLLINSSSRDYSEASQMVCHFLGYRQFCNIRQHIITLKCHQNESILQIRIFIISYFIIVWTYEITNTSENGSVYNSTSVITHLSGYETFEMLAFMWFSSNQSIVIAEPSWNLDFNMPI